MGHEFLSGQTAKFTDSIRDCFRDMLGIEMVLDSSQFDERPFAPRRPMVAMIHFTGRIQGDYVINLEEETAAGLIGAWTDDMPVAVLKELRGEFGGLFKELLNTAVGMSIPSLEEKYGRLTYHPPLVIYGELDAPVIPSSTLTLRSGSGNIDCCVVLDMAGDEVEKRLVEVMEDLKQARHEVQVCYRILEELVSPDHRTTLDPALLKSAEEVMEDVRRMLESGRLSLD